MKLIKFCLMRKKDDNTMPSVNEDLLDDSVEDDSEDSILDDFHDFEIEHEWISIWGICYEDFSDDDLDEDEVKSVNEKTSKRLLKLALKIRICDVRRKSATLE